MKKTDATINVTFSRTYSSGLQCARPCYRNQGLLSVDSWGGRSCYAAVHLGMKYLTRQHSSTYWGSYREIKVHWKDGGEQIQKSEFKGEKRGKRPRKCTCTCTCTCTYKHINTQTNILWTKRGRQSTHTVRRKLYIANWTWECCRFILTLTMKSWRMIWPSRSQVVCRQHQPQSVWNDVHTLDHRLLRCRLWDPRRPHWNPRVWPLHMGGNQSQNLDLWKIGSWSAWIRQVGVKAHSYQSQCSWSCSH